MASPCLDKPGGGGGVIKRLGELLQEEQEPFLLDVYLVERGYYPYPFTFTRRRKEGRGHQRSTTTGCYPCPFPGNKYTFDRTLKRFSSGCGGDHLNLNKAIRIVRNRSIPQHILRNINKLLSVSTTHRRSTKSHRFRDDHYDGRVGVVESLELELDGATQRLQALELDRVSSDTSSSCTTVDSCSNIDHKQQQQQQQQQLVFQKDQIAHNLRAFRFWNMKQVKIDRTRECQRGCGNKQLSAVGCLLRVHHFFQRKSKSVVVGGGMCRRGTRSPPTCTRRKEEATSPPPISNQPNKMRAATEDPIFSASLGRELLLQRTLAQKDGSCGMEKAVRELLWPGGGLDSSSDSQFVKTKRVVLQQQTRELLLDGVREAIEKYRSGSGSARRMRHHHQCCLFDEFIIGPEELGKIISDDIILAWGKQSANITNLNQIIEAYLWETMTEKEGWSDFLKARRIKNEIATEIADAILEKMTSEMVADMIE